MKYYISIGSNVRPRRHILLCLKNLKQVLTVKKVSSVYETEPVGPAGRMNFWNLAVVIESRRSAGGLRMLLRRIERKLGRQRMKGDKFLPRTIDLDLLPQPEYQKQGFIMIPLAEIAPDEVDPQTGKTFGALAARSALKKARVKKIRLPRAFF